MCHDDRKPDDFERRSDRDQSINAFAHRRASHGQTVRALDARFDPPDRARDVSRSVDERTARVRAGRPPFAGAAQPVKGTPAVIVARWFTALRWSVMRARIDFEFPPATMDMKVELKRDGTIQGNAPVMYMAPFSGEARR